MAGKNIKIQVLTDLYYAKFIAIWYPEEEEGFVPPIQTVTLSSGEEVEQDSRRDQEVNVPYLLVTNSMYKGRQELSGPNPVSMGQHPMPPEFLKQQTRHISYMFANEFGIFQPPSKAHAETFLAKQRLGYTIVKEMNVNVSPVQGSISLKEFKDELDFYPDHELEKIKILTVGEHPDDANAKGFAKYIHNPYIPPPKFPEDATPNKPIIDQYITITKLLNVYDIENAYVGEPPMSPEIIENSIVPGTEDAPGTIAQIAPAQDAIAEQDAEKEVLETLDAMIAPEPTVEEKIEDDTLATDVVVIPTRDEVQTQTIKDLQAKIAALKAEGPQTPTPEIP